MFLNIVVNISSLFKQIEAFGIYRVSLRKQGCKSSSYAIYTLYYTQKYR